MHLFTHFDTRPSWGKNKTKPQKTNHLRGERGSVSLNPRSAANLIKYVPVLKGVSVLILNEDSPPILSLGLMLSVIMFLCSCCWGLFCTLSSW